MLNTQMRESLIRKAKLVGDIACRSTIMTLQSHNTYQWAGGIGLMQGLKYNGDFNRGVKAGAATVGVFIAMNVCGNVMNNYENIKKA